MMKKQPKGCFFVVLTQIKESLKLEQRKQQGVKIVMHPEEDSVVDFETERILRQAARNKKANEAADAWAAPWVTNHICGARWIGGYVDHRLGITVSILFGGLSIYSTVMGAERATTAIAAIGILAGVWMATRGRQAMSRAERVYVDCMRDGTCAFDHPEYKKH